MHKIAIIGAGQVGSAIAYTLALTGLAGSIVIIDINEPLARGEAMDISHGMPLCPPAKVEGGGYELLVGSDLVIMTAGASQQKGEDRRSLLDRNLKVMDAAAKQIAALCPECILLVVTNPLDAMVHAALERTGFPPRRVFGSGTVLDTMRLRAMLGAHTGIDPRNIHGFVLGEHGDSEFAAWSSVSISGMSMDEYCRDCGQCDWKLPSRMEAAFDSEVRRAAYRVIDMKGSTNHAIAVAVRRIAQAILRDEHAILTVSSLLTGEYGVNDVCLSLPCVIGRRGIERVIPIKLDPEEEQHIRRSAAEVRGMQGAMVRG
ncbi:MAG: L-lactate dehydrogenase [Clostridia bacterium]|nr:L-lactate dehydrogenase [Clostridia bacterium]